MLALSAVDACMLGTNLSMNGTSLGKRCKRRRHTLKALAALLLAATCFTRGVLPGAGSAGAITLPRNLADLTTLSRIESYKGESCQRSPKSDVGLARQELGADRRPVSRLRSGAPLFGGVGGGRGEAWSLPPRKSDCCQRASTKRHCDCCPESRTILKLGRSLSAAKSVRGWSVFLKILTFYW
jgi:hypothetical protein